MRIKYLDGRRLYFAFLAGGNAVIEDQSYLNKINVFPVPDADTGTNLASTIYSIFENAIAGPSPKETLYSIVDAALSGARGNSGLIFAQFIHGISQSLHNEMRLSARAFGFSVKEAVQHAYKSVVTPVEGTMITVMKDWAEAFYQRSSQMTDFVELLTHSLEVARRSLQETTRRLANLREANVVDAGAKGFVDFLEGVAHFISQGKIKTISKLSVSRVDVNLPIHPLKNNISHRYCTEALLVSEHLDLGGIREIVRNFGNSAIVAGSEEKARIHIHTNYPADLFLRLREHGKIIQVKADDMRRQYEASHARKARIALVTDSSCDLPQEFLDEHQIYIVPNFVAFGESLFLDKVTITPAQFYRLLSTEKVHPASSQPNVRTIENFFSFLASHYEEIIAITISDKLSGIHGLFRKGAEKIQNKKIAVLNTRHLSVSLGLIVARTAEAVRQRKTFEEIPSLIENWAAKTKIFTDIRTLKYLVRGGRISPLKGLIAKVLNLKPIVSVDSEGKGITYAKSFSARGSMKKILRIISGFAETRKIWNYAIVHAQNPERAEFYAKKLGGILHKAPAFIMDVSPVVGVHSGIGAVAVAVMEE